MKDIFFFHADKSRKDSVVFIKGKGKVELSDAFPLDRIV